MLCLEILECVQHELMHGACAKIYVYIYMYIWSTLEKMQLCASSNGNCNRLMHLKIWTTQEKMQLCASSNGNCNRSTDLKFRSRASRGVSCQQVHIRKRRYATHGSTTANFRSSPLQFTRRSRTRSDKNVSKEKRKLILIKKRFA